MAVLGPNFIALQVRDLDAAADFYEGRLGLRRAPVNAPHAVVFATTPVVFALREPLPGVDLDAVSPHLGVGVTLWLQSDDARALHDDLAAAGVPIIAGPVDGPFGQIFTFRDPDGYAVTIHDKAL
jgi:predicted enzyme related to lactoylglutathione lyase